MNPLMSPLWLIQTVLEETTSQQQINQSQTMCKVNSLKSRETPFSRKVKSHAPSYYDMADVQKEIIVTSHSNIDDTTMLYLSM